MCDKIRIYVADLAAYNNGILHGVWINACDDIGDIKEQIAEMLAVSPVEDAEEYAIHDYEGFETYSVSEWSGIDELHEVALFIEQYPDFGSELLAHLGNDLDEARQAIKDNYIGCYQSVADYAMALTEDTTQVPDNLSCYIDYKRMGDDMELGGEILTIEMKFDEVHIFHNL